jgi:hypothetical protein
MIGKVGGTNFQSWEKNWRTQRGLGSNLKEGIGVKEGIERGLRGD